MTRAEMILTVQQALAAFLEEEHIASGNVLISSKGLISVYVGGKTYELEIKEQP